MWSSGNPMSQSHKDKHLWSTWKTRDVKYKLEWPFHFSARAVPPCSLSTFFLSNSMPLGMNPCDSVIYLSLFLSIQQHQNVCFIFVKMVLQTLITKRAPESYIEHLLTWRRQEGDTETLNAVIYQMKMDIFSTYDVRYLSTCQHSL